MPCNRHDDNGVPSWATWRAHLMQEKATEGFLQQLSHLRYLGSENLIVCTKLFRIKTSGKPNITSLNSSMPFRCCSVALWPGSVLSDLPRHGSHGCLSQTKNLIREFWL